MSRLGLPVVTGVLVATVGCLAVAGVTLALLAYTRLGHNQTANCQQIELVKSGLRQTMEEAERFGKSSPVRSKAQREQIATFYRDALGRLRPRQC